MSLACALSASEVRGEEDDARPTHVVLVSIDTLRADHLGAYGNDWIQTPNLDRVAAQGVVFEHAIAPAPTTLASHTSLMTGTWPHTHGVPWNGSTVHADNVMLAEVLDQAGFHTVGVSAAFPLAPRFGFDQGFDRYRANVGSAEQVDAMVLKRLAQREDAPLFLFVHTFDVHWPYQPPAPFDRMYRSDALPVTGSTEELAALRGMLREGDPAAQPIQQAMKGLYAGEVSYTDQQLGRLFRMLEEAGILDDALLIVTADHGESFDEHWDAWGHGTSTYDSAVHVPLIVRFPGGRQGGTRVSSPVSTIDVVPTVLALLDLPVPERVEGVSLLPALSGPFDRGPLFSEATKPRGETSPDSWPNLDKCRAVWTSSHKVQRCPSHDTVERYAWPSDPQEASDLWPTAPDPALYGVLEAWAVSGQPLLAGQEDAPDTLEALRELGYLE